jgi:ketopantoate reductase PanE/ApbA-like protein
MAGNSCGSANTTAAQHRASIASAKERWILRSAVFRHPQDGLGNIHLQGRLQPPLCPDGLTIGEVMAGPDAWSIASACAAEAFQLAKAKGIAVEIEDPVACVRTFGEKIPNVKPSMLLDHIACRRSEIDVINGAVPLVAAEVGLTAPVNSVAVSLSRVRETKFT